MTKEQEDELLEDAELKPSKGYANAQRTGEVLVSVRMWIIGLARWVRCKLLCRRKWGRVAWTQYDREFIGCQGCGRQWSRPRPLKSQCTHRRVTRVENGSWCDQCGTRLEYDTVLRNWIPSGGGGAERQGEPTCAARK